MSKLKKLLTSRHGSEAVSFLLTTAMLLLIFATIVTAFAYISQSYHANYLVREITRRIEVSGEYKADEIQQYIAETCNSDLVEPKVTVDAEYWKDGKIQLRTIFDVQFTASYPIKIMQVGMKSVEIPLPIRLKLQGMSEVFWKDSSSDGPNIITRPKPEQSVDIPLSMADGSQTIIPDSGYALSSVTIQKPATLKPGNIKKGVEIGGVTGTLESSTSDIIIREGLVPDESGILRLPFLGGSFHNMRLIANFKESYLGEQMYDGEMYLLSASASDFQIETDEDGFMRNTIIPVLFENCVYGETCKQLGDMLWTPMPNGMILINISGYYSTDKFTYTVILW